MALHKDAAGADVHEPKGITSATANQVYKADGAGSGVWSSIVIPSGTFTVSIVDFTSTGVWTKPADLFGVVFHIIGGGGGANASGAASGAGGATSVGVLAVVNGGSAGVGAFGAGGTLGTTPSGAKGFAGKTASAAKAGIAITGTADLASYEWNRPLGHFSENVYGWGALHGNVAGGTPAVGGSGAYMYGWIPAATLGATENITIGAGGTAGGGVAGTAGYCLIEQYITV